MRPDGLILKENSLFSRNPIEFIEARAAFVCTLVGFVLIRVLPPRFHGFLFLILKLLAALRLRA
jgi:hypothetical protein